jgi:hypothetical protein
MKARLGIPTVLLAMLFGAAQAEATTYLGSPDTSATPSSFACAMCPPGMSMGFRQFALRGTDLVAPEDGVLVEASAYAKRIAGTEQPSIAVLRPADDLATRVTVAGSAPLPVTDPAGAVHRVENLQLPMKAGDTIGFLHRTGEVDLGAVARPEPDGAVQTFKLPCDPCGDDGGTGTELLFDGVLEPDVDNDGLGDETQDPDGGGLGDDWEDEWFDEYEEPSDDFGDDAFPAPRQLRLVRVKRRAGGATLVLRVPRGAGRLSAGLTLPTNAKTGAGPFRTIATGDRPVKNGRRVRLRVDATALGTRLLARRPRVRAKIVIALIPRNKPLKVIMEAARL